MRTNAAISLYSWAGSQSLDSVGANSTDSIVFFHPFRDTSSSSALASRFRISRRCSFPIVSYVSCSSEIVSEQTRVEY